MAITFSAVTKSQSNGLVAGGLINVSALGANAEISAYSTAHRFLYTVGGGSGAIVVTDLRDPTKPKVVAKGNPDLNPGTGSPSQTLQSAAVYGNLLAVAVQNTVKTDPGFVEFFDISNPALPVSVSTLTVGALPDMVKFSADGSKLLVTNEGEPDSLYTIDPEGSISVINTAGYLAGTPVAPAQADVQTIGFGAWENRRAELINRGVRIGQRLGVTTTVAQDIEPEAIAISSDGMTAWVSLQENNAIAVLDLSGAEPAITQIFSAGIKDWSRGNASAENFSFDIEYAAGAANLPTGVLPGGLSGLTFAGKETVAGTELDIFFSITDRGPNGALVAGKRQFLDPDFQPSIYKLGMNRATGAISELEHIGLNRADGTPLTGLPQLAGKDDIPIDSANNPLSYDPFGIDSETISRFSLTIGGSLREVFAVGDEYRGQIAIFDATTGNLIQRYIPSGQKAQLQAQHGAVIGSETIDSLPAIYGSNRWSNRGIEGMAYNPTDGLLYAFMQSPLDKDANGTGASRSTSQLTRILAINPATGMPVKEHLYLLSGRSGQDKIGDVTYDATRGVFLVMERDSSRSLTGFKQVYEVDLRGATDTLPLTLGSQVSEAAFPAEEFLVGTEGRAVFREVIDAGELGANGYRFNGIPDGIGVMDNGDGTLRVVVNHEFGSTAGDVRAHGSKGAYVSDLTIDKATLSVVSGKDFLASASDLYLSSVDGTSWNNGTTTAFNRFCSGDLAEATAFLNGATGYAGRIYLTGEESGAEGRAFAHVLTGTEAGRVYELASLGNMSFENVVANPLAQAKTVVASLDDTSANGQVYVYVGTKNAAGNAVEQAGLAGGITYGVRVNSAGTTNTEVGNLASPNETGLGIVGGVGTFELVNLGDVKAKTGATLNSESITAGVTNWLRPEDGAWSKDGKTFYFVTTATSSSASRLWALEFTDPTNPEAGGTVRMLLNGSEGQVMLDNMTVADDGSILLQEDPGNNARLAKIWRYNPGTDTLVELAQHNPALFSGAGALTLDEESSGVVDISSFLSGVSGYDTSKYSYFLIADQIHKAVANPTSQVEIGELSVMATAKVSANQQIVDQASTFPAEEFLVGTEGRAVFREVIDAGELGANGYRFNGIPDGIGVMDNGDGTLRVVVNHEFGSTAGDVRAHGSKGAYVSDLTIDKATLSVVSGKDFLASASDLYLSSVDGTSWNNGTTTAFNRFCSGDLAEATAFLNGATGYAGRIYLTGEESGAEGRAFAHVLTGTEAGRVYELASLGNMSFENVVANPLAQAKTVVASLDDTSANGQVYVYVGTKNAAGNAVEQAGLAGGITYGVRVNSAGTTNTEVGNLASPNETGLGIVGGVGTFELVNLGDVKAKTGATLNSESITAGVTNWLRPEDGAWSKDGKTFYFVTTATSSSASRLWALEFTDPTNPEAGGTVRMLLNGSEGQVMLDNMTVADDGSILLQEDPGNNARLAKIWRYNPGTDTLVELAQHNPALFSGAGALTLDEESSGVVDISSFLSGVSGYDTSKYSYFLIADQIHKAVANPTSQVEIGELSVMATAKAGSTGSATWNDALGVGPELLSNTRTLVDHDSNPATPQIFSTSSPDRLAAAGIRVAHKTELFNLPSIGGSTDFDKPEGLTLRDDGALVVGYDNDFGTEGASGNALTVVSFDGAGFDSSDRDVNGSSGGGNQYRPISELPVTGLTLPDGIATYTDAQGRRFLLAAGEGDSREYEPDEGNIFTDLTRANNDSVINGTVFKNHPGVAALNTAYQAGTGIALSRLNLLNDYGDLDGNGTIDKAYTIGSRSLRIFDDKGNVVFDSGSALEDLANGLGYFTTSYGRDDDKGTEPEMVEIATIDDRTYAFVALERTPTSVAAVFDITDPYSVTAVDPIVFSGAQRVEGLTFLTSTGGDVRGVIASSEGNDKVSVTTSLPGRYTLQLLHLADAEAGLLATETAPNLAALVDAFDGTVPNTLILAGGDNYIPGPFLNAGTDSSVRDELNLVSGSTITGNQPIAAVDIAIHNAIGVEASTIGNHEFDLGPRVFRDAINPASGWVGAQFPYLSANLDFSGDADLSGRFTNTVGTGLEEAIGLKGRIVPSAVVTKGGEKIGLVGATTQVLEQISSTGGVEVKGFSGDGAETNDMALLASQLQPVIDDLTSQGVNKIVLMAHLQQIQYEQQLAPLLRGVDIILAAGSNTRLGDTDDVPATFNGHSANFAGPYPIVTNGADGGTTLIVNTDNEYTYLGRLVVDFNEAGEIVLGSLDTVMNGAYAATNSAVAAAWNVAEADLGTTAFAAGTKGAKVAQLTGAVQDVIAAKDGQVWGYTNVYLEGERAFVRNQETNLGNISADANLAYARSIDPSVVVSLKNGGGIRAQIGSADVVSGDKLPPAANPAAGKPRGGVSTLDIENSLRFNNGLSLVTLTASQFRQVVEHGLVGAGTSQGRFPQIGGFSFSYDLTRPEGSRVVTMAIENEDGISTDVIVRNGVLMGDPARTFRMVTLNFLAGGGDSYPFPSFSGLNRLDLQQASNTGPAVFSPDGTEQDALAEYLLATTSQSAPYTKAETTPALDQRLQNLAQRIDTVVDPATLSLAPLSADKAEGNIGSTPFTFTIQRDGDPSGPVTVAWAVTASGPNPADALDFAGAVLPSGVATLAPWQTSQQITINVVGDGSFEADESFSVDLINPVGGVLLASASSSSGLIRNDDVFSAPVYTFSKSADAVDEGSSLTIGVSTTNVPAGSPLFWRFSGTGITASDVSDGVLEGSTVLGSDGRAGFSKAIASDPENDPNETLELRFFSDAARTQQVGSIVSVLLRQPSVGLITDASDNLIGTSANDTLSGVPTGSTLRGQGSLDRLTGVGGDDLFVLGDAAGRFYDDGTGGLGSADLALISDFNAGDRIQLHGLATDYRLISGRYSGVAGVRIDALSPTPEAIGFVQGATLASLNLANASQFLFV
jgi:2',3'-cyclic-nucleotide 2'-phosphodiesterase (5'-nucleotidase family)/sugar lactone lactonase YvrE